MATHGGAFLRTIRHYDTQPTLRHAIAVHLLDEGADVAFVQDRLGHANIQNTLIYMRYTTVRGTPRPDTYLRVIESSRRVGLSKGDRFRLLHASRNLTLSIAIASLQDQKF